MRLPQTHKDTTVMRLCGEHPAPVRLQVLWDDLGPDASRAGIVRVWCRLSQGSTIPMEVVNGLF